jgi:L-fuculokinase
MKPVIAIFDIGKTNKKLFLFDEGYHIVWEKSVQFPEIADEDGDACEDVHALTAWLHDTLKEALSISDYTIKAINCAAYGASFVYLDAEKNVIAPLYNYLKPFPTDLKRNFYKKYGGQAAFARTTASPILGNLNSGLQMYRLKKQKKDVFDRIQYALHLPQYISAIFSGNCFSEMTSIGCHTALWDFDANKYHNWVVKEDILHKLPPLIAATQCTKHGVYGKIGSGLHDSSSALIPYLACFEQPFILVSTGTWCIAMNPFNKHTLTAEALEQDCLCYMTYQGKPVKASRAFLGFEHEEMVKKIANEYCVPTDFFKKIRLDKALLSSKKSTNSTEAYHQYMVQLAEKQVKSIHLVLQDTPIQQIFIDGGFSKNEIYMYLLAQAFPNQKIYAASVAQATALGAAMAIHSAWNEQPLRSDLVELKHV